ncbi:pectinesterase-like [Phoenix dactylifera]|uniref:Pectinesterase n=1 Tax=Phoenix dactylifera TaxID=42345 RepID=A0A8B7CQW8_PHODC|nr:pectinesterase-like [Phoenix dactylifera]
MAKKVLIGAVSGILLVAAVIGVVAGVMRSSKHASSGGGDAMSSTSKYVSAFCEPTQYRETCESTLSKVSNSTTPNEMIQMAINATKDAIRARFDVPDKIQKNLPNLAPNLPQRNMSMLQDALTDCKKLLEDTIDFLDATYALSNSMEDLVLRSTDVITWMTSMNLQVSSCLDGIEHPVVYEAMIKELGNSTQLRSNALTMVARASKVFQSLGIQLNTGADSRRRLLAHEEAGYERDSEGYPKWLSTADRKLLAQELVKPNVVVAKDGSGNFKTINDALKAMPAKYTGRYIIYVKAGVYNEKILVDKQKTNLFIYGDGSKKTIVTGHASYKSGVKTDQTATFAVQAPGFICKNMGFRNTAGPEGHQAVAFRVNADLAVLFRCRFDGYQDTLYVQSGRHFFRNCVVSGTVDFIFGGGASILQNCLILIRRPMDSQFTAVTAAAGDHPDENSVIVIHNSRIRPDTKLFPDRLKIKSYLGRPWKAYAKTVVMETDIGDLIQPEGWKEWDGKPEHEKTAFYAEFQNRGPGSNTRGRVRWPAYRVIKRQEAQKFTVSNLLYTQSGDWIALAGAPQIKGLHRA